MAIRCPQCGNAEVLAQRTTLPQGTAYEYYCDNCGLREDAFQDRVAILRLRVRWGEVIE